MKRRLLFILIIECLAFGLSSQCQGSFNPAGKIENAHRVNVISHPGNLMNEAYGSHGYKFDDGNLFDLGYARGLWVGGLDPAGNLKLAISTYPKNKENDFGNGPLITNYSYDEDHCLFYDRVWTINQYEVVKLISDFNKGILLLDSIPFDIREWPAIGNPYIGRFAPEEVGAPFFDQNGDLKYDPMQGDYPIALVENPKFIPHQFRFTIYNDKVIHQESFGDMLSMEFHQLDYVVNCTEDSRTEDAIFTRLKCINKGIEDLRDFKLGVWGDLSLGCSPSTYVGCSPKLDCSFVYKKDGLDHNENGLWCKLNDSIPENIGVISSLVSFNKSLKSHVIANPDVLSFSPTLATKLYALLSGTWEDGTPVTVGGTGNNPGSLDTTKFIFDGRPDLPNEWSMQTENSPSHKYYSVSTFTNETLLPGQMLSIDFADYVIVDYEKAGLTVFENMEESIEALKSDFANLLAGNFDCGNTISKVEEVGQEAFNSVSLFPNPTSEKIDIQFEKIVTGNLAIYSLEGSRIKDYNIFRRSLISVDVSEFSTGFYVINFRGESGDMTSSYFIKE